MIGVSSSSSVWICPAQLLLGLQVDRRDVVRSTSESYCGFAKCAAFQTPWPVLALRSAAAPEEHVRHAAVAVVDEAHHRVEPVGDLPNASP